MKDKRLEGVFTPPPPRALDKGDITTREARRIMDEETIAREEKTKRLRAARLAQEQEAAEQPAPVKTRGKKS